MAKVMLMVVSMTLMRVSVLMVMVVLVNFRVARYDQVVEVFKKLFVTRPGDLRLSGGEFQLFKRTRAQEFEQFAGKGQGNFVSDAPDNQLVSGFRTHVQAVLDHVFHERNFEGIGGYFGSFGGLGGLGGLVGTGEQAQNDQ
jgi:hypothetical protein